MNAIDRTLLRRAIDARRRALVSHAHEGSTGSYKGGCRCDNCRAAAAAYKRTRRADPERRARENELQRIWRAKKKGSTDGFLPQMTPAKPATTT